MRTMRTLLVIGFAISALTLPAEELPISGLAHAGYRVSDLAKAKSFYTGVLGYEMAFTLNNMAFFKVNDDQYLEISANLAPDQADRFTHVAFLTADIAKLRQMLAARGLNPPEPRKGKDGNLNFSLKDPDGHQVEFVQYLPGSLHSQARGKSLGSQRISGHLQHVGIIVANLDAAMAFYRDKLDFHETWRGGPNDNELRWVNMRTPGTRGDYIEFMLYSKPPSKQQLGSMHHICLEVPEIQPTFKTLVSRGVAEKDSTKPRIGINRRWLMNISDPDGTRTEIMEPKTVN